MQLVHCMQWHCPVALSSGTACSGTVHLCPSVSLSLPPGVSRATRRPFLVRISRGTRRPFLVRICRGTRRPFLVRIEAVSSQAKQLAYWQSVALLSPGITPGYGDEVIFADGTFIDGSTAELSAGESPSLGRVPIRKRDRRQAQQICWSRDVLSLGACSSPVTGPTPPDRHAHWLRVAGSARGGCAAEGGQGYTQNMRWACLSV